jgi:hypothetical protein
MEDDKEERNDKNLPIQSKSLKLKCESNRFYEKLLNFISLNMMLAQTGYTKKLICEMDDKDYEEYLVSLEYLHQHNIINLDNL